MFESFSSHSAIYKNIYEMLVGGRDGKDGILVNGKENWN